MTRVDPVRFVHICWEIRTSMIGGSHGKAVGVSRAASIALGRATGMMWWTLVMCIKF
jgi:hypothetical protein